ncbi:MAG: N-acetylglutamate synthase-like GNAT family acetyltransferase [Psychromonas sp.]|jgi:N-acetylglutamate synthase-like GNAT family acetyltransferase
MKGVNVHLKVLTKSEVQASESQINLFLSNVFNSTVHVELSDEFVCGVVIKISAEIIGCGFAYARDMCQGQFQFKAGIVGAIAVNKDHRGKGLCKQLLRQLDNKLKTIDVSHSFLFAYEPKTYQSSGYVELQAPICYFDKSQNKWNQFVYCGGMVKPFEKRKLASNTVIEFQGCVY